MNLKSVIEKIKEKASNIPNIGFISTSDIYDLNNSDINYPAFVLTQNTHNLNLIEGFMTYSFNLFYVDRLTESKDNEIDLNSIAMSNLGGIILQLYDEGIMTNEATFVSFTERFQSLCSGAYASINFNVPISECEFDNIEPHCN